MPSGKAKRTNALTKATIWRFTSPFSRKGMTPMITITPENPSSDDPVEFEFTFSTCNFYKTSTTVNGSQFILKVSFEDGVPIPPCVATSPPATYSWSVGRLKAGEYQVRFEELSNEPVTQAFSVSQGQLPLPVPSIPDLGIPAAILLAVALAWFASRRLKRDA